MDVMKRVNDLMNRALDDAATENEKLSSALGAIRLIRQYELLGKKRIDVAVDILDKFTSPDFVQSVATRAEGIVDGFTRLVGSAKKLSGVARESTGGPRRRRRQYGGRQ